MHLLTGIGQLNTRTHLPRRRVGVVSRAATLLFLLASAGPIPANAALPTMSAGGSHSIAVKSDRTVRSWGDDSSGQLGLGTVTQASSPRPVVGLTGVIAISAGAEHAIALKGDGTVWTWGANESGQLGDGSRDDRSTPRQVSGLPGVIAVAAGHNHSLAVTGDGRAWTWGRNNFGQLGDGTTVDKLMPAPLSGLAGIATVSGGYWHSAALATDGTLYTWGENGFGTLGDGTSANKHTPIRVAGITNVARVSAGSYTTVAVTRDGAAWGWGYNAAGVIGDGTTTNRFVPTRATGPAASGVASISIGGKHTMALKSDGNVLVWGFNEFGQLGDGTTADPLFEVNPTPRLVGLGGAVAVAAGSNHSVATRNSNGIFTWGLNYYGQLGEGTTSDRLRPTQIAGFAGAVSVSAGEDFTIALKGDGTVWAWGRNNHGQLGGTQILRRSAPNPVALTGVVAVAAGTTHTLAAKDDGSVFAWGANGFGQLGDGSMASQAAPKQVPGLTGVVAVSAGFLHSLALRSDGTVLKWGLDGINLPIFGYSPGTFPLTPTPVLGGAIAISAGGGFSLALKADGSVWAWGGNDNGQLGDGTTNTRLAPAPVIGLSGVVAISAGRQHAAAVKNDGSVWAWGLNDRYQAGDGTRTTPRSRPVRVIGITDAVMVAAGDDFTLAVHRDGTVSHWGSNRDGTMGNGGSLNGINLESTMPRRVDGLADVAGVAAGAHHVLAHRTDGTALAWGRNPFGELGDGTFADRFKPAIVVREGGGGTIEAGNWFIDLNPSALKSIPPDKIPVFLAVASGTVANLSADIKFRAQDIGTTGSVYVFAIAPADIVRPAADGEPAFEVGKTVSTGGSKEPAVSCVLSQLTASGQLQAASASSLQAFVTGVLSGQGQAVTVINGVPTVNIGGATFYVGYGVNAGAMLTGGLNRSVASVPGAKECKPQAPQTGWWWYPPEDGRGYSIEVQGNKIFFAAFLYDTSGRSSWHVATGTTSLDGSLFTGDLLSVKNGQTLFGAYKAPNPITSVGPITLAFNSATSGTMVWPGGTVPLERFNIVPNGLSIPPQENLPETGWWWNPQETGRGFFIEWQGGKADLAGYMYDDTGEPVWYLTVQPTPDPRRFAGNWWTFADGQTLLGAWKPNRQTSDNFAPVTIQFQSATTATLTLPGGRATQLIRHRF